jgi:hypothetical protein
LFNILRRLMEKEKEEEGEITVKFGFILGTAA